MMKSLLVNLSDNDDCGQDSEFITVDKNSMISSEIMMILSTRPCDNNISNTPFINDSILNYGVSDVFDQGITKEEIAAILASRIKLALVRFEPRLNDINVVADNKNGSFYNFIIEANSIDGPVCYRLFWDDVIHLFSILE